MPRHRHRHLKLKRFLDSISESLIREYFTQKVKGKQLIDFETFDYDSVNEFLDTNVPEQLRDSILEDFHHIDDICETVMNILVKAVGRYHIETTGEEKREELAMKVFLYHKNAFEYAYDYYLFFNATSKMSHHDIAAAGFEITRERKDRFKTMVREFYFSLAKGQECDIRYYTEEDQVIIVVSRGSYKRSVVTWKGEKIETFFFRPAVEDILQFDKKSSVLSIKTPYQKDRENYIKAFTTAILEDESQFERPDRDLTYSLKPLQDGTFSFEGNEVITSIALLEIKLALRGFTTPTVVIRSSNVLETLESDIMGVSLKSGELVSAKFMFKLKVGRKQKKVTFEITPPNVTDLTRKKYADIIGDYLKENGVKLV